MDAERIEAAEEMWDAISGVDRTRPSDPKPIDRHPCAQGWCGQPCPDWENCAAEGRSR